MIISKADYEELQKNIVSNAEIIKELKDIHKENKETLNSLKEEINNLYQTIEEKDIKIEELIDLCEYWKSMYNDSVASSVEGASEEPPKKRRWFQFGR